MRVIAIHSEYRTAGGEEKSFAQDLSLLEHMGHDVVPIQLRNAEFGPKDVLAGRFLTNSSLCNRVAELILPGKTLLYANNLWPSASPAVLDVAMSRGVPVLQAVRNYRLVCAAATLKRDGEDCSICLDHKSRIPGVIYRCFDDSATKTLMVTMASHRNSQILRRAHAPWILAATSSEVRNRLVAGGYPADRVVVRPNYLFSDPGFATNPGHGAIYAGRLSREKGIEWLLDLWRDYRQLPDLHVYGDGPLRPLVDAAAIQDSRISVHGPVAYAEMLTAMADAAVVLVPSDWDEPFGRTAMEALAVGTPPIASRRGALPDVVGDGGVSLRLDARGEWAEAIATMGSYEAQRAHRARARARFEEKYSREAAQERLTQIIDGLVERRD